VAAKKNAPRQRAPRREPDLDAVLEASVECLLENGERGFRIEQIIERTGISRSSLYLHFTDRDGLVEVASLEIFFREVVGNIDRTIEAMGTVTTVGSAASPRCRRRSTTGSPRASSVGWTSASSWTVSTRVRPRPSSR